VHIVGIGGAGMSGIARVLAARGVPVSGSDAKDSRRLQALRMLGIDAHVGHLDHVEADTLIVSTAIPTSNSERTFARVNEIPELSRAQALAEIMRGYTGIAVSGTHGKTTTTSMLTVALQHCGADPSFVIGSELNESGSNAHVGSGNDFVVEADESDGSFLALPARVAIVTNVEPDHLDHWGEFDALEQAYQAADLFVLPSHYEGYGMVITEAIAHGLPIVTTTGGALATTLPPTAGLATPPGDATALATALRQVITDPHRHDQLARGARIARETLADWQPAIATVMALVQEMNQDA
jgi:UDP-N-acetylmuramate-alanine ligase